MTENYIEAKDGKITSFVGPKAVDVYAMRVLAMGLRGYALHGIMPNRAYTPTAMLRAAERWTGQKFKRGQYMEAAAAVALKADDTQRQFVEVRRG